MKKFFDNAATKKLVKDNTSNRMSTPANKETSPTLPLQDDHDSSPLWNLKMFLSKVLASPADVMQDLSFLNKWMSRCFIACCKHAMML
jgi:hypothetical protein